MNDINGIPILLGDTVKIPDEFLEGTIDSGYYLAICRYGQVVNFWRNDNTLCVELAYVCDTERTETHPDGSMILFNHNMYMQSTSCTLISRKVDSDAILSE